MTDGRTPIRDLACADFVLIPVATLTRDARSMLASSRYGLVQDPGGMLPVALITQADVARLPADGPLGVDLPAAVFVAAGGVLADIAVPSVMALLELPGVRGAVLLSEDSRPQYVLPAEVVDAYFGSGEHRPAEVVRGAYGDQGDGQLIGGSRLPLARVLCAERGCRYPNNLIEYDMNGPPPRCQNPSGVPHQLRLPRR